MRLFAPPDVEALKEKGKVSALIRLLGSGESTLRSQAAQALGELGDERAAEPLLRATMDSDEQIQSAGNAGLVVLGRTAVDPLIKVIAEAEDPALRDKAHEALLLLPPPEDVPRSMASVVKRWYRTSARNWWQRKGEQVSAEARRAAPLGAGMDGLEYGIRVQFAWREQVERTCDDGNEPLRYGEGYFRPGGYLVCEEHIDLFLNEIKWDKALQDIEAYLGPHVPERIQKLASAWA